MIKLLRFLFILSAIVLYTGCTALQEKSKDKYIADYEIFVKEVRVLHDNFTEEEQNEILLGQRSNNTLSVNKLNTVIDVPHIKKSVFDTMHRMKERISAHDVGVRFV